MQSSVFENQCECGESEVCVWNHLGIDEIIQKNRISENLQQIWRCLYRTFFAKAWPTRDLELYTDLITSFYGPKKSSYRRDEEKRYRGRFDTKVCVY